MFRLRLWRTDLEKILSKEFPGIAPIHGLQIIPSTSGDSITLIFDTPALTPTAATEVQDISEALFVLSKGKGG